MIPTIIVDRHDLSNEVHYISAKKLRCGMYHSKTTSYLLGKLVYSIKQRPCNLLNLSLCLMFIDGQVHPINDSKIYIEQVDVLPSKNQALCVS